MDESHRYRASAGVRAINELRPILGLELTATPLVETARGVEPFKNVIYDYALGRAMEDGFVKEPAVVTRKDFSVTGMQPDEIERLKLEDGIRLHESVKVELESRTRKSPASLRGFCFPDPSGSRRPLPAAACPRSLQRSPASRAPSLPLCAARLGLRNPYRPCRPCHHRRGRDRRQPIPSSAPRPPSPRW
jgi:hypothetical protein